MQKPSQTTEAVKRSKARRMRNKEEVRKKLEEEAKKLGISVQELKQRKFSEGESIREASKKVAREAVETGRLRYSRMSSYFHY